MVICKDILSKETNLCVKKERPDVFLYPTCYPLIRYVNPKFGVNGCTQDFYWMFENVVYKNVGD